MNLDAPPKILVTKTDAMRRQLLTAVKLWFAEGDPVAIHTLLYASHEILHTLFRRDGHKHLLFNSRIVKPEYRTLWAKTLTDSANFFKHARSDPDGKIEFNVSLNEMYLLFSIYGLAEMGAILNPEEHAFMHWIFVNRPDVLNEGAYDHSSIKQIEMLRGIPKNEFLQQAVTAYRLKGR